jgi:hypothetical protein
VRDLLIRTGGATLQEIMAATGWQAHTVRGFISTLPKKTGSRLPAPGVKRPGAGNGARGVISSIVPLSACTK